MGLFSFGTSKKSSEPLNWTMIQTEEELNQAIASSSEKPSVFFKHSTRCSISSMALNRFENSFSADNSRCNLYFIDLIGYRAISNEIAEKLNVQHQSPQVIVVDNNEVVYTGSHSGIDTQKIESLL
jgi:bacillithiol system protein YtxJ